MSLIGEYVIPSWVDDLIVETKEIEEQWKRDTFRRYRECGQLMLDSGYKKGKWNDLIKKHFMEKTGYSKNTISRMIRLAEMNELEFEITITKFNSLYKWVNATTGHKETRKKSVMVKMEIPANRFKNEREATIFFSSFDGVYEGLFYHGKVNRQTVEKSKIIREKIEQEIVKVTGD